MIKKLIKSIKFGNSDIIYELNQKNAYNYIKQVADYLFEVQYSTANIDYNYANNRHKSNSNDIQVGKCSGCYINGKVLRHEDWYYDKGAEFIISRVADEDLGIHASIGIACDVPVLTKSVVESLDYNEMFKTLPFATSDGINDAGIYVQQNVVPKKYNVNINPSSTKLCSVPMLPRYILDYLDNLDNLESLLNELNIYSSTKFNDFDCHIMVADSTKSVVIEFKEDSFDIIESPIITNFRLNDGFEFNPTTYAPNWNTIEPYGLGVERWELCANAINTSMDLKTLRQKLFYTNAYKDSTTPRWLTENTGNGEFGDLTVQDAKSDPSKFDEIYLAEKIKYENRSRDKAETWQTVHSVIYDINAKSMNIVIQERNKEYNYNLGD